MANGRFTASPAQSTYSYDAEAAFYREQEEARRLAQHTERAAMWIAGKLAGHQYDSLQTMERSVVELVETVQGGEADDDMRATIKRACVLLWMGEVDRDSMYRRCVVKSETGLTFSAA